MKKIVLPLLLVLAFMFTAVSCGDTKETASEDTSSASKVQSEVQSTESKEDTSSSPTDATIDADDFENPNPSDPASADDTSSTFSIIIGDGDDEEGWGEIF